LLGLCVRLLFRRPYVVLPPIPLAAAWLHVSVRSSIV
jgi:hypothetical protein